MSDLADIEATVVALIAGIEEGAAPVFASVRGLAAADRKSAVAAAMRLSKPAAIVSIGGREKVSAAAAVPGDPRVTVLVVAGSLRSGDEARLGGALSLGAYKLADLVTRTLDGAVAGVHRLIEVDEQIVVADERTVALEQRWLAQRPAALVPPTFGGVPIAGAESVVSVQVGAHRAETVEFGFPGIDGVFRRLLGVSGRVVRWTGQLRAAGHSELTAIESAIEAAVGDGRPMIINDSVGRTFEQCVADAFNRHGPRQVHPLTGAVVQDFELIFRQLTN